MDITSYNREAWDKQVESGNAWTLPVSPEQVVAARRGDWQVVLTPLVPVPREWLPKVLVKAEILALASAGGQQGPILAAAGANVTVFDNSPKQLERDRMVASRDHLSIRTVQGDMADLSAFPDLSFDVVFNPVSTCFVPDVRAVWKECARVLRPGGSLLVGFVQPHVYCFDEREDGPFLQFRLPVNEPDLFSPEEHRRRYGDNAPLEFSHTFTDQLGGMMTAGLQLVDMYEDVNPRDPLSEFMPRYMAVRALKPQV